MPDNAPAFDPTSMAFIANPYPAYHALRASGEIYRSPLNFRVVSQTADIVAIVNDRRFGIDYVARLTRRYGAHIFDELAYATMKDWILWQDPPHHTRLRGLVVKAFNARRVQEMRPRIEAIVATSLDRLEGRGAMDVIHDFALPLPVAVICDMLGIPEEDQAFFLSNMDPIARLFDPIPPSREELDAGNGAHKALSDYFHKLFALRRRQPGNDLTTQLVQAEEEGQKLTEEEMTSNVILLFTAGHETTVNLVGNGLLALYRQRDQLDLLRADPGLVQNAVEELLRYDPSVQIVARTPLEDVTVGANTFAKGEHIVCILAAANRDPVLYPNPDRLDITRQNIRPISFGGGVHHCLGAQLARIEGQVAFSALMTRLPTLELDDIDNPVWRPTFALRGLKALPAHW